MSQKNVEQNSEQHRGDEVIYLTGMEEMMDLRKLLQKKRWEDSSRRDEGGVTG